MRVRAHKVLLKEPTTTKMVPALAHILALAVTGKDGRSISQILNFLMSPAKKLCTELAGAEQSEDEDDDESNGKAPAKQPRSNAAGPRKTVKKAREPAPQPEIEPSLKRQRGARGGKQKAAPQKPAAKPAAKSAKKPSKRKAAEVEAEVEPEAEAVVDAEEHEGPEGENEEKDVQMQEEPEEPIQQEEEEEGEYAEADDDEDAPGLDMHPGHPAIGGPPLQHEVLVEAVQHDQQPLSQDEEDEEPEPPPPGLENDLEHAQHVAPVHVARPKPAPVVAPRRPGIGSQASPCDAAQPGSHGRSLPPQLGPHALQPPLEGVATSSRAAASHDVGNSASKARARGQNKRVRHPTAKATLGVQGGTTSKKSALFSKRGATAVAAVVGQQAKPDAV